MYHPTGRVLTVLELLQSRPGLTGRDLAARLEMDVRTVRRYIVKLQDVGIPVEATAGRQGGYRLRPGYKMPPLIFTEEEAAAIVLGLLGSAWLEIEQSRTALEGALSKITRVLSVEARERVTAISSVAILSPHREETRPDLALLMELAEAIQVRQCISMEYLSESLEHTQRVVEPYGIVGRRGRWYLVAYCRLRRDYRTFRLDRMSAIQPTAETFTRNERFDYRAYAERYLESYPVKWRVDILFHSEMATVRRRIPTSYGELSQEPVGVRFRWPVDDLDYAARYLMALQLRFSVDGPPELLDALRRLAEEALRAAGAPGPAGTP